MSGERYSGRNGSVVQVDDFQLSTLYQVTFVGNYATLSLTVQVKTIGDEDADRAKAEREAESLALEYYGIDIPQSGLSAVEIVVEKLD